jgi:transposase
VTAVVFREFLQRLMRGAKQPIILVVDGHPTHKAKLVKEYVAQQQGKLRLVYLPPYSPQLNPQENVWDEIREKNFPNRVFSTMEAVRRQLQAGLAQFATDAKAVTSLTAWPWIRNVLS